MKTALIIGSGGQDGTYLTEYLSKKKCRVVGVGRNGIDSGRVRSSGPVDILKFKTAADLLVKYKPDEIYYLAAYHHSAQDRKDADAVLFQKSFAVHVDGLRNFLEGMRLYCPSARFFYAGSSHMFGHPADRVQNEETPLEPVCIYGITKTAGVHTCRFYRRKYGLFASVGILYNHESPLRAEKFVSQKIVRAAIAIKLHRQKELVLGNLNAVIDWGYAGDYVEAMHRVLSLPSADDFVIASGKARTVKQFVEGVFNYLKLDWKKYVHEDASLIASKHRCHWQGDPSKLKRMTGWKPKTDFPKLIALMVNAGLKNYGR